MHCLCLVLATLFSGEDLIDGFRYADNMAAGEAWIAGPGTPPVEVVRSDGAPSTLLVRTPFAGQPKLHRCLIDRRVAIDLSAPTVFSLELSVDPPEAIGYLTLYFRSGNGWYVASKATRGGGWQTLRFTKALFVREGNPAGWRMIDGVRLSVWRPTDRPPRDASVRFRALTARWNDVALIVSDRHSSGDGAAKAWNETCRRLEVVLSDLGVGVDRIDETGVSGALRRRRVAIVGPAGTISTSCADAIAKFVDSGGKVIAFDSLPKGLTQTLRLSDELPAEEEAEIGERGALLRQDMVGDGRQARRQLVRAFGSLEPSCLKIMAEAALKRVGNIGHCTSVTDIRAFAQGGSARVAGPVARGQREWERVKELLVQGKFSESIEAAEAARESLVEAYLGAAPSVAREGRAFWNHSGTGPFPGDWERSAKLLAENGFNMILPNMLWAGTAHSASEVLPRSAIFSKYGDQIEQCCAAAKRHGLEVHVWKVHFNLSTAPTVFVERLRREGRTQVSAKGEPTAWLCPSHPENRKLEVASLVEVARKYPVAGLHLDYIRYPGRENCYCDGCRRRFEVQSGRTVDDWPKECYSGQRKGEYSEWRCQQITTLVAEIRREVRRVRSEIKISAAVFGSYPACRESVAQDWPAWVRSGDVDFVCPMNYTSNHQEFAALVKRQVKLVEGRVPLYAGIAATVDATDVAPDRVVGQIVLGRSLGAAGFVIFDLTAATAKQVVPAVGRGVGVKPAARPHEAVGK